MSVTLADGLILPPDEKSEAEYRAKIARGEVRDIAYSRTLGVSDPCPICGGADLGCTWGLPREQILSDRDNWK